MALSMDLRTRLLAAVDSGSSCRAAAARFGVAPSTAVRWRAQQRETGDIAPKLRGGDMRSRRMVERAADILAIWEERNRCTDPTYSGWFLRGRSARDVEELEQWLTKLMRCQTLV